MKAIKILLCLCFSASVFHSAQAQLSLDSTVLDTTTLISGMDIPWEMQWGPDGWIWVTERYGMVTRVNPENGEQDTLLDITNTVYQDTESGLLGMVHHPGWDNTPWLYMVYTYRQGINIFVRLVHYEYDGQKLVNETILLDNITGNTTHDGSRLIISPDNKLLMSTGDAQDQPSAQNTNDTNGKILRLELDGSVPADNPIAGSYIWTWGHRNPQGLAYGPTGILYSSEHGPTTDDEFNIIQKGRNYGWPTVHGFCNSPTEEQFCLDSNVVEPLVAWTPTIATSDIAYYNHDAIPEWKGSVLLTVLKDAMLVQLKLNEAGDSVVSQTQYLNAWYGRLRDVLVGPEGEVYLATSGTSFVNSNPHSHRIVVLRNNAYDPSASIKPRGNRLVAIFPNPAEDMVTIKFHQPVQNISFSLYDVNGKLVQAHTINGTHFVISRGTLGSGIYFAQFGSDPSNMVEKILFE